MPALYARSDTTIWAGWAATTTASTTCDVWDIWTSPASTATTTAASSTAGTIWVRWSDEADRYVVYADRPAPRVRTAAEFAAEAARTAAYEAQARELRAQRDAAERRAEQLLLQVLSLEQRQQFNQDQSFVVEGRRGYRYRIRKGRTANIDMVRPDGRIEHRLCVHPREDVPDFDTMVAQKVMLEADEDLILKTANRHPVMFPERRVLPALH